MAFNKVILIGNMVADPELKQTTSGVPVCSFTIAVNRRFAKQGDAQQVDFINIVSWRQTAEFVSKYFQKGRAILVCGALQTRAWTDNNNQKRYTTEVVADEVSFVDKKQDAQSGSPSYGSPAAPAPFSANPKDVAFEEMSADDDLPF